MMMTGCGSALWMAPEMLLGQNYNESVDVFSYAMCLVELIDCNLPWTGVCPAAAVVSRVTAGRRPLKQLEHDHVKEEIKALVRVPMPAPSLNLLAPPNI